MSMQVVIKYHKWLDSDKPRLLEDFLNNLIRAGYEIIQVVPTDYIGRHLTEAVIIAFLK